MLSKHRSLALALTLGPTCLAAGCVIDRGAIAGPELDAGSPDAYVPPGVDAGMPDANLPDAYGADSNVPDAFSPIDAFAPDAYVPIDAFMAECSEGATRCSGAVIETCSGGRWSGTTTCGALGCGTSARDANAHCLVLEPSNVAASEMRGGADINIASGNFAFDTTSCGPVSGGGFSAAPIPDAAAQLDASGTYCVVSTTNFTLNGALYVFGSRPLIVLATGDITMPSGSLLSVGAYTDGGAPGTAVTAGPGASTSGEGGEGGTAGNADGGGGGGSFCGAGGVGGSASSSGMTASGGAGGASVAAGPLTPLRGGANGGDGSGNSGSAGGGGGAVQLTARGTLTLGGAIYATGGGGAGGETGTAGGGGGSGGGVLLEATNVSGMGSVNVRGGGGGGAGCGGSTTANGYAGANGYDAPTGGANGCMYASAGGDGSSGSSSAGASVTASMGITNGGGGGGGAGCVAVRSSTGTAPTVSPSAGSSVLWTGTPNAD